MRELMLELLCYEPFGKFLPEEEKYICEVLSDKKLHRPPSMVHDLFSGFHYYVHRKDAKDKTKSKDKSKDIDWLRVWINTYHQNQNYTNSTKSGRAYYPLLFKKICFYIIVQGEFTDKEFMGILGLKASIIQKWGISPRFRKYAEADTYSGIKSFRNGVKKEYIVSTIKKLYYEAGRQTIKEKEEAERKKSKETGRKKSIPIVLKNLPIFVDVFAGTASVAASVVSDGCPPPIVNDYDPIMVCFAWAFTHCRSRLRKEIVDFHDYVRKQKLTGLSYDANAYEDHIDRSTDSGNLFKDPKVWDDPVRLRSFRGFWEYSEKYISKRKELAQYHQEFVMRARSSYMDVKKVLLSCDREELRKIDFNKRPPRSIDQKENVLDYALATFYYYSFAPGGKTGNVYHETIVDVQSYISYLHSLQVDLDTVEDKDKDLAQEAQNLMGLQLKAVSLTLKSTENFSRHLKNAKFYSQDFESLLQNGSSDRIYYLDSPYFLTVGYDVAFSDDDHKEMLDYLRDADFKWIFSMQYNPSSRDKCTSSEDEAKRGNPPHIKDYRAYYRGFYAPFQSDADQKFYVAPDAPIEDAKGLFAILFDFDAVRKKWPKMKTKTREMLVVNFNCLSTIPLHDTAVVLPFKLFLECADKEMSYQEIVQLAIAWREDNITSKFADKNPV